MSERAYLDENEGRSLTSRRGFPDRIGGGARRRRLMAVPGVAFARATTTMRTRSRGQEKQRRRLGRRHPQLRPRSRAPRVRVLPAPPPKVQRAKDRRCPSSTGLATRFAAKSTRTSCVSATMRRPTCRPHQGHKSLGGKPVGDSKDDLASRVWLTSWPRQRCWRTLG